MRKLGKENRKLFILMSIIVIFFISIFVYFITMALDHDNNIYDIDANTLFYDEDFRKVVTESTGTLKRKYDGKYHLTTEEGDYTIGAPCLGSNQDDYALKLYGTAYQISTDGTVTKVTNETSIAKAAPAKFYKLKDRKYLFVDQKIYTEDDSIDTSDYLIIELDKQGNATLANDEINVKTINPLILKGSVFDFDVANEKLIYDKNEIDLKNIIGSSNEYIEDTDKNDNSTEDNEEGNGNGNNNIMNYYDQYSKNVVNSFNNLTNSVNNINENSKDTVKKDEIYFDFSRWSALKKVSSTASSINIDYIVFDPNSEYQALFILIRDATGEYEQKYYLNKDSSSYVIRNLVPDNEYTLSFGYRLVSGSEDVYEDTVTIKTKVPSYSIDITRVTRDTIYYTLKVDSNYAFESANISLYSDSNRIAVESIDYTKISNNQYSGKLNYSNLGYLVEVKLEDIVYNGNVVMLDVSDKFINE